MNPYRPKPYPRVPCMECQGWGWIEDWGSCAPDGLQTKRCPSCKGDGMVKRQS